MNTTKKVSSIFSGKQGESWGNSAEPPLHAAAFEPDGEPQ